MNRIRVLIVDDEPLAREGIRLRLALHPDIEVVGSVGTASDAPAAVRRLSPDLVFLDVQMPGMSGFDVLADVGVERVPVVIFVTAHDQYALRAFRAHALDYLLKPVDDVEFAQALARARQQLAALRDGAAARRLRALLADVAPPGAPGYAERLAVKQRGRTSFVAADEIEWIEGDGDYVCIHGQGREWVIRETLRELEARLDPDRFMRIHRSTIVRLGGVLQLLPHAHGEAILVTTSGARHKVSRTRRGLLARALRSGRGARNTAGVRGSGGSG